jgi:tRNA (guanine-N7-)-methyltransferase
VNYKLRIIKSFVIRSRRLAGYQKEAFEKYSDRYLIPYYQDNVLDMNVIFQKPQPVVVEIGFGMGTSLVEMASNSPGTNYLGVEVHRPGIGNILDLIHRNRLVNLKVIMNDAIDIFRNIIPAQSLQGIQIFFPDPWPKKRHNKRRLVNMDFMNLILPSLVDKGFIHFVSDWCPYAEEALEIFTGCELLTNKFKGFSPRPDDRPQTKFEKKGEKLGHSIRDIIFIRDNNTKSS